MGDRQHIDILLTQEENELLKRRAKDKGMRKTEYARMKIFTEDETEMEEIPEGDKFVSLNDFAKMLYISKTAAWNLCNEKKIEYYKVGRYIRIRKNQIEKFRKDPVEKPEKNVKYMNTMQASEYLATKRTTILKLIKKGTLHAVRIGREYHILREDLDNLMAFDTPNS